MISRSSKGRPFFLRLRLRLISETLERNQQIGHDARVTVHIVEEGVRGVPKTAQCGLPESCRRQQATVLANSVIFAKHQSQTAAPAGSGTETGDSGLKDRAAAPEQKKLCGLGSGEGTWLEMRRERFVSRTRHRSHYHLLPVVYIKSDRLLGAALSEPPKDSLSFVYSKYADWVAALSPGTFCSFLRCGFLLVLATCVRRGHGQGCKPTPARTVKKRQIR